LVLLEPEIAAGRLCVVASAVRVYCEENAVSVRAKLEERGLNEDRGPHAPTTSPPKKRVSFKCSSRFAERSEEFSARPPSQAEVDDLNQNAYVVGKCATTKRKPGLLEVPGCTAAGAGEEVLIERGKRVIGSVSGVEALSAGYLDCTPAEMLIDAGAVASLVHVRVLKLIGRADEPLRPYLKNLNGVTGHKVGIKGVIDLSMRLGSREMVRPFVVVNHLHVDAILGTDTLKAYRAVIDLDDNSLTLKDTGEVFPLVSPRVEEMHESRMNATVKLQPGGQAIVVTEVLGEVAEGTTVLVEGLPSLDETVKLARSLGTVQQGKLLVEICNASMEDVVLRRGTLVAAATLVPESAFQFESDDATGREPTTKNQESAWTNMVISSAARGDQSDPTPIPELEKVLDEELNVEFEGSKLGDEQQQLMRGLLGEFKDMFVETSMTPGRTDLLEFEIDTGTHPPIKQRPYRVSKAEGDVMGAEIQQYLSLGHIRPSTSPWASPVLMIRKLDGGIRFCIDYRRLNAVTVKDCYPMPLIDDILDVLGKAKLFSTMAIASGYWNVPMAAGSVEKTAFMWKYGLFEWLVMPFGLCNAIPAFERLMEGVLGDLKWRTCLVYLDDCVVFSEDFPTHLVRLRQVLERF